MALTVCFGGEGRQTDETNKWTLTTVCAHMDFQRAGAGAALVALWERADALVGVGLLGFVLWRRGGSRGLFRARGTVVHEVRLEVPLTAVPDPTVFTRKDILIDDSGGEDSCHAGLLREELDV